MKTKKIEKWLLLEQSGELSPRRRRLLNGCPEAQSKRAELNALCAALPALDAEPSPRTVIRITARLREEHRSGLTFSRALKPALALAASLMVVGGILNFHGKQTSSASALVVVAAAEVDVWNDPLEEELGRLENLIIAISGDPLDIMEM
jgi:hypothetical protein